MKTLIKVLATLIGISFNCSVVLAQSIVIDGSTATIVTPDGNRYDIRGGNFSGDGKNLFHSFEKFGLDTNQIANFLSNPNIINILTRVTGGNASTINGLIQVTGGNSNLLIMNPAGIIFGSGASLNVPADFTATTATRVGFNGGWFNAIGPNDYVNLVGNPTSYVFSGSQPGTIINAGNLSVNAAQNLALMGGAVINTGTLNAPGGNITVTAVGEGGRVKISQEGQILSLEVDAPTDEQGNILPFAVKDVPALLTGNPVDTNLQVTPTGVVQIANSGTPIPTTPGTTIISGNVNASNVGAAALGGEIIVTGTQVGLVNANLDASGRNGGGTVLIGGEYQGQGTIPNAQYTYVSPNSVINANALETGKGGQVIVWSDQGTQFLGSINARGGQVSGDGGFVETSGKAYLNVRGGSVNASAINGQPGVWLLDPTNVVIADPFNIENGTPGTFDNQNPNTFTPTPTPSPPPSIADRNTIETSLNNGTSVRITTTSAEIEPEGNITVADSITKNAGGDATLTLEADNSIIVNSEINITSNAGRLNLIFNSDRDNSGQGAIVLNPDSALNSNGGNIIFGGGSDPFNNPARGISDFESPGAGIILDGATINAGTGNISLRGQGGTTGDNAHGILLENGSVIQTTGTGSITLSGNGGSGDDSSFGNQGILVNSGAIISSENGNITLTGNGGSGDNSGFGNQGILVNSAGTVITSQNGNITLTGQGGTGSTGINRGVNINNGAVVESTGSGNITLNGLGGTGDDLNEGVLIQGSGSRVTSNTGNITINGTRNPSDPASPGIGIDQNGLVQSTGSGAIALNGNSPNAEAILLSTGFIQGGSGPITLTGDEINLTGTTQISGTGELRVQPLTPNLDITVGGTVDNNTLNFSNEDISKLQNGFSGITIGRSETPNLTIAAPVTFVDPLTLQAGTTTVNGTITGADNGSVTINSSNTILNANIITQGNFITLNSNLIVGTNALLDTTNSNANPAGAEINLSGTVNSQSGSNNNLTLNSGNSNIVLGNAVGNSQPLGNLILNSNGITQLNGASVTTTQQQIYNSSIQLGQNTTLIGESISFNRNLNLQTSSLTIAADNAINFPVSGSGIVNSNGNGNLVLQARNPNRSIGIGTSNPEQLQITNFNQLQTANLNSLTIGQQGVTPSLIIGQAITFFDPTILQANNIEVNAPITGLDNASITINGSGTTTTLNADIVTSGNPITINDNIKIGNTVTLNTTAENAPGGAINLNGNINSVNTPQNLTLTAGNQTITVTGAIGNEQPLNNLTANTENTIQLNGGTVTTSGDQTYTGDVRLGTNTVFNATGNFSANSIEGEGTAIQIQASNITVDNDIDSSTAIGTGGNVTLTTPGNISTGNIISGSDLSSPGSGGDINLSAGGNIQTQNLVSGSLSNQPGGNVNLNSQNGTVTTGAIISGSAAGSGGDVAINAPGNITTTGPIITLGGVNGGNVDINSTQGTVNVDPTASLAPRPTIEVNGRSISLSGINTSATVGEGGDVTINAPVSINTAQIDTSSQTTNGGNVTLDSEGDIQVTSINAQGGNNGIGGTVDITTDRFFRATGTFSDRNGVEASISSTGGIAGGPITIRHGGQGVVPFTVGEASINGTAGEITSGTFNIDNGNFLFTERRGNVAIISVNPPPPPVVEPPTPPQPNPNLDLVAIPQVFQPEERGSLQVSTLTPSIAINSLSQIQNILTYVQQETAQEPALIYVGFAPPGLVTQEVSDQDLAQREENLTAQYQRFLNLEQQQSSAVLSLIPEEDYELELILITRKGQPYRIQLPGVTRQQVTQLANDLYVEVSNLGSDYKGNAIQLYDWLLKPLQDQLKERQIENVLFFMPSGLRLTPIAALYDEDNQQFVVEKEYTVGLAPSLNLVDYRYRDLKNASVLAFGASQFSESQAQTPLPAVQIELPLITNQIRSGQYFINEQFTLDNVQRSRNEIPYPIVHLATHADFDVENPAQSYIQLYNQRLQLPQWRSLDLNAPVVDLLVISACQTAVGNPEIELGFGGMAVQSGVKTAIASLWYVGDTGTLALMDQLYQQLKTAPIKAVALQQAQRAMLTKDVIQRDNQLISPQGSIVLPDSSERTNEDLSHPYYWASFTLIGSPW